MKSFQRDRGVRWLKVEPLPNTLALMRKYKDAGGFLPESWYGHFVSWFLYAQGGEELSEAIVYHTHEDQPNDYAAWKYRVLTEALEVCKWHHSKNIRRPVVKMVLDWMHEVSCVFIFCYVTS
ncbi:hypothetical protein [Kordiimonas gwangyangensis]|uniref:hypothetical protein n=1 Tax=Kordiimonas gwangyangensis TaxID=288022 RepID=UPI0012DC15A1|nr:hypothetical protein [Kordiimonas gwangyangensis]